MSRRKLTPAHVVVFPKKPKKLAVLPVAAAAGPVSTESPTVIMDEDVVTSTEAAPDKPKRRRASPRRQSLTELVAMPGPDITPADGESADATTELISLGHALFEKGKVREAKIVFEGLALSLPHDAFVRTMLGTVCLALNELPNALVYFEAALELDPGDVAARVYRGELRLHRRKLRPAIEDFEYVIAHGAASDPFVERAHRLLKMARKPARASR